MKIFLATDHAGFELKEKIKAHLLAMKMEIADCGAFSFDKVDDYPDFIGIAAREVSRDIHSRAIVFGGSGEGEAMVANRERGVRATVYYGGALDIVRLGREHNNSNVLSLGARFLSDKDAMKAVDLWLKTPFSGEARHKRRIEKF